MPCWYFEKKELRNTPSFQDGIDSSTESRYRREGARFIIDAGTKMGLRYDTCATGVVYFHRFYMFHSFKEFHRYITAACCLFLAGKVEETPKKCRDIIKICQNLLSPQLFTVFGEDPREEVMTLERILLQTIKFDLQVEHPYSTLLKFAKVIKGDKEKIQKLVQMAWTFINDSLCTTLSLQWEPEIISVSLMYLGTRLTKFDIQDWHGRVPGTRLKWWEFLVEDITVELMEDICHRVLDLYSSNPQSREDSPPMTPPKKGAARDTPPPPPPAKRSGPNTPAEILPEAKVVKKEPPSRSITPTPSQDSRTNKVSSLQQPSSVQYSTTESGIPVTKAPVVSGAQQGYTGIQPPAGATSNPDFSNFNPYMPSQMFSSSFMSQEGSKSIQTLMSSGSGGNPPAEGYGTPTQQVPPVSQYPAQPPQYQQQYTQQNMYSQQPPSSTAQYQQPPPTGVPYTMPQPGSYPPPVPSQPYSSSQNMPHGLTQPGYPGGTYPQNFQQPPPQQYQYPPGQQQNYQPPPFGQNMPQGQHYHSHRVPNPGIPVSTPPRGPRVTGQQQQPQPKQTPPSNANSGLTVRISGRR